MKKIMFNDKYGLTQAVLEGRETMTRRILKNKDTNEHVLAKDVLMYKYHKETNFVEFVLRNGSTIISLPAFNIGEEIAVAQKYKDLPNPFAGRGTTWADAAGWENKMFVKAEDMPHHIRITDIKVERMQDISDKDCMREGITMMTEGKIEIGNGYGWNTKIDALKRESFFTPKAAFAALIDKISGKGTWESNPWVFVYEFELIRKEPSE